jgi:DNA-binding NtrC family response regulator
LIEHFLARLDPNAPGVSPAAAERLAAHHWPGNVRELEHVIERAFILSEGAMIALEHLPMEIARSVALRPIHTGGDLPLHEVELRHIERALEEHGGHRERAATALGISERTLYRRLKELEARCQRDEDHPVRRAYVGPRHLRPGTVAPLSDRSSA